MWMNKKGNVFAETLLAMVIMLMCCSIGYGLVKLNINIKDDAFSKLNNRYWLGVMRWSIYHYEDPLVDIAY